MAGQNSSEPSYSQSKDVPWYHADISDKVTPKVRYLLEIYAGIPPKDTISHVHTIRDKVWCIRSYPCTGMGTFLTPTINFSPAYKQILSLLRSNLVHHHKLLDIGYLVGQDLRRLVFDGALSENLYAMNIVSLWDIGYELYRDRDRFHATFFEAGLLKLGESENEVVASLRGDVNFIWIANLLRQWDWETQFKALRQIITLSKLGTIVVGQHVGMTLGRLHRAYEGQTGPYMHDGETWRTLWEQLCNELGTTWEIEVGKLVEWEDVGIDVERVKDFVGETKPLAFVIKRFDAGDDHSA